MGDKSAIEWTDATWNPVRGCAIVSKGCTNCYAMRQAHRFSRAGGAFEGLTKLTNGGPVWTGDIRTVPELLHLPWHWKRPRRIFVNSMRDLFHEDVPLDFLGKVWWTMARNPRHIFQILTKRPQRMLDWLRSSECGDAVFAGEKEEYDESIKLHGWPLRNVWLGVSVEDQAAADERIPLLLQTPAAVRWISAEPLLGPMDLLDPPNDMGEPRFSRLERVDGEGPRIDWVVVGGESGPGARPMHPDWARSLRRQCARYGVAFFFKQWGNWLGAMQDGDPHHEPFVVNASDRPLLTTKRAAGRLLDGRTHDEYPA